MCLFCSTFNVKPQKTKEQNDTCHSHVWHFKQYLIEYVINDTVHNNFKLLMAIGILLCDKAEGTHHIMATPRITLINQIVLVQQQFLNMWKIVTLFSSLCLDLMVKRVWPQISNGLFWSLMRLSLSLRLCTNLQNLLVWQFSIASVG